MEKELDIIDYVGDGYKGMISYESWRVAFLRYAERFDAEKLCRLERHLLTDEVFVLLEGEARLIIGDGEEVIDMEAHKLYNVKKGVWHGITVSRDAKVLIVENDDTGLENTEYREYNKERTKQ